MALKVRGCLVSNPQETVYGEQGAHGAEGKTFIDEHEVIYDTVQVEMDNGEWVSNDAYLVFMKEMPEEHIVIESITEEEVTEDATEE